MERIDDYVIIKKGINKVAQERINLLEKIPSISYERYRKPIMKRKRR